jgi:hypothetical protein
MNNNKRYDEKMYEKINDNTRKRISDGRIDVWKSSGVGGTPHWEPKPIRPNSSQSPDLSFTFIKECNENKYISTKSYETIKNFLDNNFKSLDIKYKFPKHVITFKHSSEGYDKTNITVKIELCKKDKLENKNYDTKETVKRSQKSTETNIKTDENDIKGKFDTNKLNELLQIINPGKWEVEVKIECCKQTILITANYYDPDGLIKYLENKQFKSDDDSAVKYFIDEVEYDFNKIKEKIKNKSKQQQFGKRKRRTRSRSRARSSHRRKRSNSHRRKRSNSHRRKRSNSHKRPSKRTRKSKK